MHVQYNGGGGHIIVARMGEKPEPSQKLVHVARSGGALLLQTVLLFGRRIMSSEPACLKIKTKQMAKTIIHAY